MNCPVTRTDLSGRSSTMAPVSARRFLRWTLLLVSCVACAFAGDNDDDRSSSAAAVECFLSANSTQITEIPRTLTCKCLRRDVAFSFVDDILARFAQQLVDNVRAVSFVECVNLRIRSGSGGGGKELARFKDRLSVNVVGADSVVLFDDGGEVIRSFFATNATHVQVLPARSSLGNSKSSSTESPSNNASVEWSNEELYFYIMIGLAGLLLTAVILLVSLACCRLCNKPRPGSGRGASSSTSCTLSDCCAKVDPRSKRVSRSDSWRFESNVYVKPNERQRELRLLREGGGGGRVPPPQPVRQHAPVPEYSVSAAARHMLPYQLVPLREASFITARAAAAAANGKHDGDDDTDQEDYEPPYCASRPAKDDFEVGGGCSSPQSRRSEANTASYGSRNNAATMPLEHAAA